MWEEYTSYGTGNFGSVLYPDSCIYDDVQTSGYLPDVCWPCGTDINDIWYYFLYDMLCNPEKKKCVKSSLIVHGTESRRLPGP